MPLYKVRCDKGHVSEVQSRMRDRKDIVCPECGGETGIVPCTTNYFVPRRFQSKYIHNLPTAEELKGTDG